MNTFQGLNIYQSPHRRQGFHRFGNHYNRLIDRDYFLGIDPLEDSKLTSSKARINVRKEKDNYTDVEIALSGYQKKDLHVTLKDNVLIIEGEKNEQNEPAARYHRREHDTSAFRRSITLDKTVNLERIEAKYEQGILTIRLHRIREGQARLTKKIDIK